MKKVSNRLYLTQKIIDYIGVVFLGLLLLFIWQLTAVRLNCRF